MESNLWRSCRRRDARNAECVARGEQALEVSVFQAGPGSATETKRAKTADAVAAGSCDMEDTADEPVLAFTIDVKVSQVESEDGHMSRVDMRVGMGADRAGFWTMCDTLKGDVGRTNRRWRRKLAAKDASGGAASAS